jgi:hypothetical protein
MKLRRSRSLGHGTARVAVQPQRPMHEGCGLLPVMGSKDFEHSAATCWVDSGGLSCVLCAVISDGGGLRPTAAALIACLQRCHLHNSSSCKCAQQGALSDVRRPGRYIAVCSWAAVPLGVGQLGTVSSCT